MRLKESTLVQTVVALVVVMLLSERNLVMGFTACTHFAWRSFHSIRTAQKRKRFRRIEVLGRSVEMTMTVNGNDDGDSVQNCNLFIFGYGNVGREVCEVFLKRDDVCGNSKELFHRVYCTRRHERIQKDESHASESDKRVQFLSFEDAAKVQLFLRECTHVLVTIPPILLPSDHPNRAILNYTDAVLDPQLFSDAFESSIAYADCIPDNCWIGYVSTTGVYGNHDNRWVTESSPINCDKHYGKPAAYCSIEQRWMHKLTNPSKARSKLRIFRCSGLYGNDFSALHTLRKNQKSITPLSANAGGTPVPSFSSKSLSENHIQQFTSRIHLNDAARAIVASMTQHTSSNHDHLSNRVEIYNLADDEPAPRSLVMSFASKLLQSQQSSCISKHNTNPATLNTEHLESSRPSSSNDVPSKPSQRRSRRNRDRKRVSNEKMREELLSSDVGGLRYPTYREGLMSVLEMNSGLWFPSTD